MLLYLHDTRRSFQAALAIIDQFGFFSGVKVNWDKLLLFPLSGGSQLVNPQTPLQQVFRFKYLGIHIQRDPLKYLDDNVYPVLQQFICNCNVWKNLPLTPVGRVNLIKMSFLPKFLYVSRHSPVPIPAAFFDKLDRTISSLIWAGSTHPPCGQGQVTTFLD